MRNASASRLAFVLSLLVVCGPCFAIDQPDGWYGRLGPDRVRISFSIADLPERTILISKVSKDEFLCESEEEIASGTIRVLTARSARVALKIGETAAVDGVLNQADIRVGGIPYTQLAGKLGRKGKDKGKEVSLSIRRVSDQSFIDRFKACTSRTQVSFLPGVLQALIQPDMRNAFEKIMSDAGLSWRFAHQRPAFSSAIDQPDNLVDISGIAPRAEASTGHQLLKHDFVLDVQRVLRPSDQMEEKNSAWVGSLGDSQVVYDDRGGLMPPNCNHDAEGTPFHMRLADINTYAIVIGDKSGGTVETTTRRQFAVEMSIPLEKIETETFILDGKSIKLSLKRALAGFELRLSRCSEGAYEPRILNVVINPEAEKEARAYFSDQQYEWTTREYAWQNAINVYTLRVAPGEEVYAIRELRKQPWLLDVWQQAQGAGDPPGRLYFASRSVYRSLKEDQENLRVKLRDALQKLFAKLPVDDAILTIEGKGLSYALAIQAPMEMLGNADFKGFWLKTKVMFEFSRSLDPDDETKTHDLLSVEIPDAWLARWPSPTKPPPEGHYDHLSPTGDGRSKNFTSTRWLQKTILDHLRVQWSGVQ